MDKVDSLEHFYGSLLLFMMSMATLSRVLSRAKEEGFLVCFFVGSRRGGIRGILLIIY